MYIVAGLPPSTHNRLVAQLKARFPQAQIVGQPSSPRDGLLYPSRLCEGLSRSVSEFAVRKRKSEKSSKPAPKFIMLLYVPSDDDERLLAYFDFTVMPIALSALQARDAAGVQMRHSAGVVESTVAEAIIPSGQAQRDMNLVIERLNRMADSEALLLPPINFHCQEERLSFFFKEFRNGARPWTDRVAEMNVSELKHDNIDRIPDQKTRRAYVDARHLAFLMAHQTAFHGDAREIAEEAKPDEISRLLRALYRFGGPLQSGLHHDVQKSDGTKLERCEFDCDVSGRVAVTASHANIYPTDFVRGEVKQKI